MNYMPQQREEHYKIKKLITYKYHHHRVGFLVIQKK